MHAAHPGVIKGGRKGFSLISGRHRICGALVRGVVDAKNPKLPSVDRAARSDHIFPPSG
jgi:hypothetical protein